MDNGIQKLDMVNLDGMTVIERLYHFGLLAEFDKLIAQRNEAGSIEVLTRTKLSVEQATKTVQAILHKNQTQDL